MIAEISAALGGIKAGLEVAKALQAGATQAAVNDVKLTLQESLMGAREALGTAQASLLEAADRERQLEAEIARLKDWSAEREAYELAKWRPGTLTYVKKAGMEAGEPPHHLCPNCFGDTKKSILQPNGEHVMRDRVHVCGACRFKAPIGGRLQSGEE